MVLRKLTSLIPYWDTHQGYVFLNDGRVGFALEAFYPPLRLLSDADLEKMCEGMVQLLRQAVPVGGSMRVYLEVGRSRLLLPKSYTDAVRSAPPAVRAIHESRIQEMELLAAKGELRDWRVVYTLLVKPGLVARDGYTPEQMQVVLQEVQSYEDMFVAILARMGVVGKRLDDDSVRDFLFRYYNPGLREYERLREGSLREQVAVSRVVNRHHDKVQIGDIFATGVSLVDGPEYTLPGTLDALLSLPGEFTLVLEVVHLDQLSVSSRLNLNRVRLKQVAEDLGKRADPEMLEAGNILEEALRQRARTGEHIVRVSSSVLLFERDWYRLADLHSRVYSSLSTLPGARVTRNHGHFFEFWLAAAPFSGVNLSYAWTYLDSNAAMMIPLRAPWRGAPDARAFYLSREGSLVGVDPFNPRAAAYNGLVVGGSGSGKTFFTQSYLASFLLGGGFLAVIDKGDGYLPFMELFGGQVIRLQPGSDMAINPFDLPQGEVTPDEPKKQFLMAVLRAMVGPAETPSLEDSLLMAAIDRVYLAHTFETPGGKQIKPFTLSDFRQILLRLEEAFGLTLGEQERAVARDLALRLTPWTGNTPFGKLVDQPTTIDLTSNLIYFETTGITGNERLLPVGVLLLTDLVWRRVQRNPAEKKLIVFDEVWTLFRSKEASAFIEELYRRLRRYNAGAIAVSQDIEGFRQGYAKGILESTYHFFLMSSPGQEPAIQELLGLSERTVNVFRQVEQRKEVLYLLRALGQLEGDVLRYYPSAYEVGAFSTDPKDQEKRNRLAGELGGVERAVAVMAGVKLSKEISGG